MPLTTCDQCRLRKIKCGGGSPCVRCRKANLECSRNYSYQKRGPKSSNGSMIRRIRTDQVIARTADALRSVNSTHEPENQLELSARKTPSGPGRTVPSVSTGRDVIPLPDSPDSQYRNATVIGCNASGLYVRPPSPVASIQDTQTALVDHQISLSRRPTGASNLLPSPEVAFPFLDCRPSRKSNSPAFSITGSTASSSTFTNQPLTPTIPTSQPAFEDARTSEQNIFRFKHRHSAFDEPAIIDLAERTSLPALLFSQCLKQFFRHLHASYPVLHEASFLSLLREAPVSRERECLLLSLCAFTTLRAPPFLCVDRHSPSSLAKKMVSYCHSARCTFDWVEKASLMMVIASYFLCMTYYDLEHKRSYEHYLREAIELAYTDDLCLDMGGKAETNDVGKVLHQRVLVLLYITNRSSGVQRHKSILQMAKTSIPSLTLDPEDEPKLRGLHLLTDMFDSVCEDFIEFWVSSSFESAAHQSQFSQLLSKKDTIDQLSLDVSDVTETQQPDLLVTLRWLRLAHWQLALKKGLVSSTTKDETLSYQYPKQIAHDLCEILQSLPVEAVFRHGRCILEKIFDITYALTDCLAIAGIPHEENSSLIYLRNYLLCAPQIHHGFAGVLQKHIEGYTAGSPTTL